MSSSSSRTSRPRGAASSNVGSTSVRFGTRHPLEPGMEASHPGSIPPVETMRASPTFPIRMATAGCYRNAATEQQQPPLEKQYLGTSRDGPLECVAIAARKEDTKYHY